MGAGRSRVENSDAPLGYILQNFSKFGKQADYGVKMKKGDLIKFCQLEWPTFGVHWTPKRSFVVEEVIAIHEIVMQNGYWNQFPYIDCWLWVVQNQPPWIKNYLVKSHVMVVKEKTRRESPVLPESNERGGF